MNAFWIEFNLAMITEYSRPVSQQPVTCDLLRALALLLPPHEKSLNGQSPTSKILYSTSSGFAFIMQSRVESQKV